MTTTVNVNQLAAMDPKSLLDVAAMTAIFNVSARTITRWSQQGDLPSPAKLGGRKFWFSGKVLAHIEQRLVKSEQDAARRLSAVNRAQTP